MPKFLVWTTGMESTPPGPRIVRLTDAGVLELVAEGSVVYWTSGACVDGWTTWLAMVYVLVSLDQAIPACMRSCNVVI